MSKLHGSSTKWDHITYNYGWWDSRLHTLTNHSLMVIWKPCGPSCLCSVCDTEIPCSNTAGLSIWSDAQVHAERNVWLSFSMRDLHSDTVWLCQILFDCVRYCLTVSDWQILFDCVRYCLTVWNVLVLRHAKDCLFWLLLCHSDRLMLWLPSDTREHCKHSTFS